MKKCLSDGRSYFFGPWEYTRQIREPLNLVLHEFWSILGCIKKFENRRFFPKKSHCDTARLLEAFARAENAAAKLSHNSMNVKNTCDSMFSEWFLLLKCFFINSCVSVFYLQKKQWYCGVMNRVFKCNSKNLWKVILCIC